MEEYFKRLKEMLLSVYESKDKDSNSIYDSLILKHENEKIHSQNSNILNDMCLYLCYKSNGLDSLTSRPLPFSIEPGLDFQGFSEWLDKLKLYHYNNEVIGDDNYYDLVCRALESKGKVIDTLAWKSFSKHNLEGHNSTHTDFTYKLYLPVANGSLERFATRLLAKCSGRKIDYDFKINNDPNVQRADNVVIYATSQNLESYIDAISSILEQDKSIKLNLDKQHPFAFPYINGVSIAPYAEINGESFSSIVCNKLSEFMNRGYSFEQFYSRAVDVMNLYHKYLLKQMNNDGIPLRGCEQKNSNSINNEGIGEPY